MRIRREPPLPIRVMLAATDVVRHLCVVFLAILAVSVAFGIAFGFDPNIASVVFATLAGAYCVLASVRCISHHLDPRHAKLPPDLS